MMRVIVEEYIINLNRDLELIIAPCAKVCWDAQIEEIAREFRAEGLRSLVDEAEVDAIPNLTLPRMLVDSLSSMPTSPQRTIKLAAQPLQRTSQIRRHISMSSESAFKDGSWHGVIESGGQFPPEEGRYHMYIGLFCPFAHRANLIRHLKGLTDIIDLSIVKPYPKGDDKGWPGWKFPTSSDPYEGSTEDHLFGSKYLHEVYFKEKKDYKGRYSVPVLWDKKTNQLVNNESLELLRNLNTGFNSILPDEYRKRDYYPEHLRKEIDEVGKWMQDDLNTGVYKAGFAPDQATYDKNVIPVFKALNRLEELLSKNCGPYVLGKELTELDLRLYPTLIRFDTVYVQHFKCNLGTIRHDYPLLNEWMKNLYWNVPGFKETTDFRHIKENYTKSHGHINPKAITPMGPIPDIEEGVELDWNKVRVGGVKVPA